MSATHRLPRRQQVPQENRHRLHDVAAATHDAIRLTGIAGGHETARPHHHEPGQIVSLFLIRFDHADKLAPITENLHELYGRRKLGSRPQGPLTQPLSLVNWPSQQESPEHIVHALPAVVGLKVLGKLAAKLVT
jgi:hypothetical protein